VARRRTPVSPDLAVRLLGPPRIERDGRLVAVDTRKAIALLAYLALAGRSVGREELAALLWPESDHAKARAALRRTLSSLSGALEGRGLVVEGDAITLDLGSVWVDVVHMRHLLAGDEIDSLRSAVELHRGNLLAGFALRDSVEFDEWQLAATDRIRRDVTSALARLVDALEGTDVDEAIAHARRWVELDPLDEAAHRSLIRLHARKGDRAAAARQYRECVALLERELGVEPGAETTQAYEASTAQSERPNAPNLHELVGDLLTLQGRYGEAGRSYETALTLGAPLGSVRRKQADLQQRLGDYDRADVLYAEALDALATGERAERARLFADRSLNAHRRGRTVDAEDLAAQALAAAQGAGDDRALAQVHNIAGILATHRGDLGAARSHLEASLALSEKLADPAATVAALNNLALALKGTEIEGALRHAQRALDLCARVGDRHREAAMHSNLADLLRIAGRDEEARAHLRTSASIFAEVGEPDELRPEIWKLVEW